MGKRYEMQRRTFAAQMSHRTLILRDRSMARGSSEANPAII